MEGDPALEPYRPTFVSVTYGAGGGTRDKTVAITGRIARETSLVPMAHLTCVGHTREELEGILDSYARRRRLPRDGAARRPAEGPRAAWTSTDGGFNYALELVELAKERGDFRIGVAAFPEGHPGAESLDDRRRRLVAKAEAGAEFAVTQMFFRAEDYFGLVERVRDRGVDIPILPGIMPILNLNAIRRQGELIGTNGPRRDRRPDQRARTATRPLSAPRASRSPPSCARRCSPAARPACTSTRSTGPRPRSRSSRRSRSSSDRLTRAQRACQAGPIACATSAADWATNGTPAPGAACAPAA